ncbi:MAG: PIN/TRAM domain-containing protein [Anaerolineae bacterium]
MRVEFVLRLVGMLVFALAGWQASGFLAEVVPEPWVGYVIKVVLPLASAAFGLFITPWLTTKPFSWVRSKIRQLPAQQLVAAIIGLIIGLIVAALLAWPLSLLPGVLGEVLPFIGAIIFGYLGIAVMTVRQRDMVNLISGRLPLKGATLRRDNAGNPPVLLDTSVIIDGRIADISRTGFISGTMLIPRFVLNELQHIADSSDMLRRNRGRRGLEMLNKLRKESVVPIRIDDIDVEEAQEVDDKLVMLAKELRCPIVTNDYNLNRVAELQGITVLNINELANAVKSIFLPGESMKIRIIQPGKELGQGVGYLDDGTMVVVENGRRHINRTIEVIVTKVLQTAAGRMIFARLEE